MLRKKGGYIFYFALFFIISCTQRVHKKKIVYTAINDSAYIHDQMYKPRFEAWKQAYETCIKMPLFKNAIYTGFQNKFSVGDITNTSAQIANKKTRLSDTSHFRNFYSLLKSNSTSNCYTRLVLTQDLQHEIYGELVRTLAQSDNYKYLTDLIDTTGITFGITTLSDNSLIPDSIVNLLQRTTDSSLLSFKKILLTPGNVMLTRDVIIFGYYSEFAVKNKMPPTDLTNFSTEQFFRTNIPDITGSIKLMPDYKLRVLINKYYTVLGEFYSFREAEE